MPDTFAPYSVTEAAQIDAQKAKDAHDAMTKRFNPTMPGDAPERSELDKLLTAPLRVDLSFDDPIASRQQLQILAAAVSDAIAISGDHQRGGIRQARDMRIVMRGAAMQIQALRGRKPRA